MLVRFCSISRIIIPYRNYYPFSITDQPLDNHRQKRDKPKSPNPGENLRKYQRKIQSGFSKQPRQNFQPRFQNTQHRSKRQLDQNVSQKSHDLINMNRKLNQQQYSQLWQQQIQDEEQKNNLLNREKDLRAIDMVNKYFQGLRINTKYAKFYNQDKFENVKKYTKSKITDVPFSLDSKLKSLGQQTIKVSSIARNILKKYDRRKLEKKLRELSSNYFTDLINQERKVKIQPNFERQARRAIASLKNEGYKFRISPKQKFQLTIQQVVLYKGLEVIRNNNYSIDSYQVINHHQYKEYKLWQRGAYKIPQEQWHTKRNMLMQLKVLVECPHQITIIKPSETKSNQTEGEVKKYHEIVFQINLKQAPKFSQFRLRTEEFLKNYELNEDQIYITNVDNKNPYFDFVFEESQKKQKLINKLV